MIVEGSRPQRFTRWIIGEEIFVEDLLTNLTFKGGIGYAFLRHSFVI